MLASTLVGGWDVASERKPGVQGDSMVGGLTGMMELPLSDLRMAPGGEGHSVLTRSPRGDVA